PAIVAAGTPAVHSTTFSYRDRDITVPIEPRHGVDALYAPRRALLDRTLVDAAADSGAEGRHGVRVDDVVIDGPGRVRGVMAVDHGTRLRIDADIVIGADGVRSLIAERVDAASVVEGRHATGVLYSYWQDCPVDGFYWRFGAGVGLGAIPTNDGATCVFVATPAARMRAEIRGDAASTYRSLMGEASAAIDTLLHTARRVEPVRGFGGHPGFIKRSTGDGWALVGDAGYFKDPLTAHGITAALRDAELLARALTTGGAAALDDYEATRLNLSRELFDITDRIASCAWTDEEVQALHRAFSVEMSREVRALVALNPLVRASWASP